MKRKIKYNIVGIDPDSEKNGICIIDETTGELLFETFDFFSLLEMLGKLRKNSKPLIVAVEGGFLKKAVWHTPEFMKNKPNINSIVCYMCKIAENVGRCNQTARLIVSYCQRYGIKYEIIPLQPKKWKKGKISNEEIEQISNQKIGRINQDERDAFVIANYVKENILLT